MFNRDSLRAILISSAVLAAGLFLLVWQYNKIEGRRLPELEREIEEQRQELEQKKAKDAVTLFLNSRLQGNEEQARLLLTENAVQQIQEGTFDLIEEFESFQILKEERLEEGVFRFQVQVGDEREQFIEILEARKTLNQYYIDSVRIAG